MASSGSAPTINLMLRAHDGSPADSVYIGLRGPQPEHGHGGPRVVGVRQAGRQRNLTPRSGAPADEPPFEWGYFGRAPATLRVRSSSTV